jgi:hypothetical protein
MILVSDFFIGDEEAPFCSSGFPPSACWSEVQPSEEKEESEDVKEQ